jgi:hypothetical protein
MMKRKEDYNGIFCIVETKRRFFYRGCENIIVENLECKNDENGGFLSRFSVNPLCDYEFIIPLISRYLCGGYALMVILCE